MERIAIVTDSTADIPEELVAQYHIQVVPNLIMIGNNSVEDGKGMTRKEFYESLPGMKFFPTTATASSGTYQVLYKKLFQEGFQYIFSIHASSILSGIYNAACVAAQAFDDRVHVIDSRNVSMGLGFQVLMAAEAAISEPVENILALLDDARKRIKLVAMLDTLEYVHRSGRISWAKARLGELLSIKPLVEIREGQVLSLGETRTRHRGINYLIGLMHKLGRIERLAILHTNAEADARAIVDTIKLEIRSQPYLVNVTTVIGTHAGPNALGFAAVVS